MKKLKYVTKSEMFPSQKLNNNYNSLDYNPSIFDGDTQRKPHHNDLFTGFSDTKNRESQKIANKATEENEIEDLIKGPQG